jgi:uncharacterized protein YfaS (alpha-2-macroglobulin family)
MSLSKISMKARLFSALGALLFVAAGALAFNLNFAAAEDAKDQLAEGDRHFTEKSYLKAYEAYEKVLKAEPKHSESFRIKLRMGKCQSQLEGYDKAEEIYKGLADDAGLNDLEKARANYHFGLFYSTRPHYYYENSKKERSWGRWIADSQYHDVSRKDAEQAKDRLKAAFDIFAPKAAEAFKGIEKDGNASIDLVREAFDAGLDAAAALHTWQYHQQQKQESIDYFDRNNQKQTFYFYRHEFKDRDTILAQYDTVAKLGLELESACKSLQTQKREFPKGVLEAASKAIAEGRGMAALSTYRKGCFLVSLTQIDDWYMERLIHHPDLADRALFDEKYSPVPVLRGVFKDYHDTAFADDAMFFVGYFHEQIGQYDLAEKAYRELIDDVTFKESTETSTAKHNLQQMLAKRVSVRQIAQDSEIKTDKEVRKWSNWSDWQFRKHVGVDRVLFKPGEKLGLWVETRNSPKFKVTAKTFNMIGLMNDAEFLNAKTSGFSSVADDVIKGLLDKYTKEEVWNRDYETGDDGRHLYTQMTFANAGALPVGSYMLEVDVGGVLDRRLVVVSDTQLVIQTYNPDENLALVLDATTGAPLANAKLTYKRWRAYWNNDKLVWNIDVAHYACDEDGRKRIPTGGNRDYEGYLLYAEVNGRYAFHQYGFEWWQQRGWSGYDTYSTRMLSMTDRPVYRPGDDVHMKVILRKKDGGEWKNVSGGAFKVQIYNPKGEAIIDDTFRATKFGALEVDFTLKKDAALGSWYTYIRGADGNWIGNSHFQVEEYKKPEFEVTVTPPSKPVKLGQAVSATIHGEYYFGGPVGGAEIKYKVYRNFYRHSVYFPRDYDWLYNWQSPKYYGTPDANFYRNNNAELIVQGTGKLDDKGDLVIEWSTQKALQDWGEWDHQYSIGVEVTDSSRRTITGSGSVKALRRQFFAFVDNRLGYYRPNDNTEVDIRCVTAEGQPVQCKGNLEIYRVTFTKGVDEKGNTKIDETRTFVRSVAMETNEYGEAYFREKVTESGTFELVFKTKDEFGEEISGSERIIVKADKWMPGSFRFDRVTLVPHKRVFKQGEECRVLVGSDMPDNWMLVSIMAEREVIKQLFFSMPAGQQELLIPIGAEHLPNFHINVLTVRNGELFTNTCQIFVPPVDQFLDVKVESDKPAYQPGEKGKFTITARDNKGKPVQAEFALTVFDRALTYIMPDSTPNIIKHFYGDLRYYNLGYRNSYQTDVGEGQWDTQKYENFRWYGEPLGYRVRDWMNWEKNAFDFNSDVSRSDKYRKGFAGKEKLKDGSGEGQADGEESLRKKWDDGPADSKNSGEGVGGGSGGRAERRARGGGGAPAKDAAKPSAAAPGEPAAEMSDGLEEAEKKMEDRNEEVAQGEGAATPRVRSNFKDSVFYSHNVVTNADGKAEINVEFPDNLTEWRVACRGITEKAKVGEAFGAVKVKKRVIMRDQAPRFFVEGDVVTLSAVIMNQYESDLEMTAQLMLNPTDSASEADVKGYCAYEIFPETPAKVTFTLGAMREKRVDWRVRMTGAGKFRVLMYALSKVESDATDKSYNCKVRGAEMYQATSMNIKDGEDSKNFTFTLPDKMDPEQTNLDIMLSPSVAALAMDALPYLLDYPYGCIEQTMSRFIPAVLVRKTLADAGISLEEVGKRRAQMAYDGGSPQAAYWYKKSPVFDSGVMNSIIAAGMERIIAFQHGDGGWGWWRGGDSDAYMSAYVVYGLATAKAAGVKFDESVLTRGASFIKSVARGEKNLHRVAYIAYCSAYGGMPDKELLDKVYDRRDDLTHMSRAMLCMAQWLAGDKERAKILISNIEDYRKTDAENGTCWWECGRDYWWWWNDKIETNAFVMQALTMVDPTNKWLEPHVKWLAQNRKGSRWNSTKDTAQAVAALMAYAKATGELSREYTVNIYRNGEKVKSWEVTPQNIFALQTNFRLKGYALPAGKQEFKVERVGKGKLYFSAFLSYFSKEDHLKASGNELAIDRKYYKLTEKVEEVEIDKKLSDGTIQKVKEKRLSYDRTLLATGAELTSGDIIEVELGVTSKNDYEYLAFEDYKPAGCEPVALRSGAGLGGGLIQNVELRDDRVAFFVSYFPQGFARLKYQLRCEIPGTFSALPTQGGSMYVPEVRANSEEWKVTIKDK